MKAMPYTTYLKTFHWQMKRREAFKSAGRSCQICNCRHHPGGLTVHHRTYERVGEELPEDLIVMCRDCHDLFHGRLAKKGADLPHPDEWTSGPIDARIRKLREEELDLKAQLAGVEAKITYWKDLKRIEEGK
ncbi:HNH endonuclease [Leptolyngbyaceae cyanobacterium CCMR0082]|uniref:HNH endonuclease n=2 Tax=Adonisia TaxID=2950183 RepID=A0A6M0S4L9_9CYAN|nr:HNH endonuclease [Adonisia turfae CCMR0082]